MSSERAREREVHRYYQTWLESSSGYKADQPASASDRNHPHGSSSKSSNDHALIAFAQLGCLRLNAKRGVVTLIASTRQYILAEATKSLSLLSGLGEDDEEDETWFGNSSLPRSQGISESILDPPEYVANDSKGREFRAPALVINDLTKHDRYAQHPFAGKGDTFYCGVPITSEAGHTIGVYYVTDDKPREGLRPAELAFMHDMSKIILQHLQKVYNDAARFRGERMVVGLGDFIRGRSSTEQRYETDELRGHNILEQPARAPLSSREDVAERFKTMEITDADHNILGQAQVTYHGDSSNKPHATAEDASPHHVFIHRPADQIETEVNAQQDQSLFNSPSPQLENPNNRESRTRKRNKIFARAADIMRQCVSADCVVFFDANASHQHEASKKSVVKDTFESSENGQSTDSEDGISDTRESSDPPSTESDSSDDDRILNSRGKRCHMLASSIDVSHTSSANVHAISKLGLTERSLRRLIRLYPRGRAFYFNVDGEISVSENEVSDASSQKQGTRSSSVGKKLRTRKQVSTQIVEELLSIVPGTRNVVWLPLWDFYTQRWCAGTFVWSRNPDRLVAAQDDRVYLKTFGNCIMMELSRLDVQAADEAKSTFIANISHELRSPLHGILGSLEFLQQTSLDPFQSSMTLAVDTCAKTLLDTVEHVLDYAKINHPSVKFSRNKTNRAMRSKHRGRDGSEKPVDASVKSNLEDDLNLATVFEEAVEAVYAGQTFRESGQRHARKLSHTRSRSMSGRSDKSKTPIRKDVERSSAKFSGEVRLILKVEKNDDWWVRTEPGAIRRIVTNILGNALKYTDMGTVLASLSSSGQPLKPAHKRSLCISVKDTGRGMSASFLQNHAFKPFSKESQFSTGTGLGLSIVRQIVHSLGGSVDLQSEKNVGTEIRIFLNLPPVAPQPSLQHDEDIIATARSKTAGKTLCLLSPFVVHSEDKSRTADLTQESVRTTAEDWFDMHTTKSKSMEGVSADFFVYAEPPPIGYLLEFHGQHARRNEVPLIILATNAFDSASLAANGIHRLTDLGRILEVISQPCGPLKLARALHRCMARLQVLAESSVTFAEEATSLQITEPFNPGHEDKSQSHLHQTEQAPKKLELENPEVSEDTPGHDRSTSTTPNDKDSGVNKFESTSSHVQTTKDVMPNADSYGSGAGSISKEKPPVLLVDDNHINLNLLVAMVRQAQHPYEAAKDGAQAVEAFEKASRDPNTAFKYVLMDINMPVMDGILATKNIRQLERRSGLAEPAVIIAVTGFATESSQKEVFEAGADYFLSKPVKFKQLTEMMGE